MRGPRKIRAITSRLVGPFANAMIPPGLRTDSCAVTMATPHVEGKIPIISRGICRDGNEWDCPQPCWCLQELFGRLEIPKLPAGCHRWWAILCQRSAAHQAAIFRPP